MAIIGMDDSHLHTEQQPGLTSIATPGFRVGIALGHTMANWLDGIEPPELSLVPFREITIRKSTDLFIGCSTDVRERSAPFTPPLL